MNGDCHRGQLLKLINEVESKERLCQPVVHEGCVKQTPAIWNLNGLG